MKKFLSIILLLTLLLSMSVTAFAANITSGEQTVSVSVPTPCHDYTVHIPASCKIEYNNTEPQAIGTVTVTSDYWDDITTDYHGVRVWLKHNNYLSNADEDSKIACGIGYYDSLNNFMPQDGTGLGWELGYIEDGADVDGRGNLFIEVFDWSNAQPGESYSVTLTYTSELIDRN